MAGTQLYGVQAEGEATQGDGLADLSRRLENGTPLAIEDERQELAGFGVTGASGAVLETERAGAVGCKGRRKRLPGGVKFAKVSDSL
jgi:hypothetical protein